MEQNPAGTGPGEQTPGLELPDFIDKGTTQSYKETFNAAVLLWVMSRRPPVASPTPRLFRYATGATLLAAIYVSVQYDPALIRHILSLK
jgi:hypothetical protein